MRIRSLSVGFVLAMFCSSGYAASGALDRDPGDGRRGKRVLAGERAAAKQANRTARRAARVNPMTALRAEG